MIKKSKKKKESTPSPRRTDQEGTLKPTSLWEVPSRPININQDRTESKPSQLPSKCFAVSLFTCIGGEGQWFRAGFTIAFTSHLPSSRVIKIPLIPANALALITFRTRSHVKQCKYFTCIRLLCPVCLSII